MNKKYDFGKYGFLVEAKVLAKEGQASYTCSLPDPGQPSSCHCLNSELLQQFLQTYKPTASTLILHFLQPQLVFLTGCAAFFLAFCLHQ